MLPFAEKSLRWGGISGNRFCLFGVCCFFLGKKSQQVVKFSLKNVCSKISFWLLSKQVRSSWSGTHRQGPVRSIHWQCSYCWGKKTQQHLPPEKSKIKKNSKSQAGQKVTCRITYLGKVMHIQGIFLSIFLGKIIF